MLDRTMAAGGPHLTGIVTPERRLNARQVIAYLQGMKHIALATVTQGGEPRVSPVDAFFLHGRFVASTGGRAYRLKHLRRNPKVSATHFSGDDVAVTVHGTAELFVQGDADAEEPDRVCTEWYGSSPFGWGEGIAFIRIEPERMWSYAARPGEFPEEPPGKVGS